MSHDLAAISRDFAILGDFLEAQPCGSGHINDTYLASYRDGGRRALYIHQRINHDIFKDPPAVMANIERVLSHLRFKTRQAPDAHRRVLTLVPSKDGRAFHRDAAGNYWRTYLHISGGRTYDLVESPDRAYEAAKAFGAFQRLLADLPGPRLNDTIPGFHHTPTRWEAFARAAAADRLGRAAGARAEIDFAAGRKDMAAVLHRLVEAGEIPERIVHNDTKSNNVIIDDATQQGLCVIDLDTVMPGLALHDFGDMVRAMANRADEDERDLTKVEVDLALFEALARGYLSAVGDLLAPAEKAHLAFSAGVIALELGLRFLTDHLEGDGYFKIRRPGHNLDRCRAQFQLVRSLERQRARLERIVKDAAAAKPA